MNRKLIYDVGMHCGEDTAFYLSRGYRVVGVEANPELIGQLRQKFAAEIKTGQLQIVAKAIAEKSGRVKFAINRDLSVWGSISAEYIERNAALGTKTEFVEVDAIPFDAVLAEHGVPYYMKIDIEGMDMECVKALHRSTPPKYLSIETAATTAATNYEAPFAELAHLWTLGYRAFKYIDQSGLSRLNGTILDREGSAMPYRHFKEASGPFGEETQGEWMMIDAALRKMRSLIWYQNAFGLGGRHSRHPVSRLYRGLRLCFGQSHHRWYDLHARLGTCETQ
jgi:FkbM family methyltransferase